MVFWLCGLVVRLSPLSGKTCLVVGNLKGVIDHYYFFLGGGIFLTSFNIHLFRLLYLVGLKSYSSVQILDFLMMLQIIRHQKTCKVMVPQNGIVIKPNFMIIRQQTRWKSETDHAVSCWYVRVKHLRENMWKGFTRNNWRMEGEVNGS